MAVDRQGLPQAHYVVVGIDKTNVDTYLNTASSVLGILPALRGGSAGIYACCKPIGHVISKHRLLAVATQEPI